MSNEWWIGVEGCALAQGDLLPDCLVPSLIAVASPDGEVSEVSQVSCRLIVITQSCDLANGKAPFVALCPVNTLEEFEESNPSYKAKGKWEDVRRGRIEGLHLLAGYDDSLDNRKCLAVDFRQIISLPFQVAQNHADSLAPRWRLQSPYLEHFSQAFARFFMRVGLPDAIAPFK